MIRLFTGFLLGFLSGWWTSPMIDSRRRLWKFRQMVYKRRLKRAKGKNTPSALPGQGGPEKLRTRRSLAMASIIRLPKGTRDILPDEIHKWYHIEEVVRRLCQDFGYREIRTPVFESTDLFVRGVGDTTDIVQKEMFTLVDAGGRSLTLRPEGTSPVVRAVLENSLYAGPMPLKLYYNPLTCYRAEKPQAGRQRRFHQFGVELFGAATPAADAEVILVAYELFRRFGLAERLLLKLNSIGCPTCRAAYREALLSYLEQYRQELCDTCRQRMDKNPMRVFDCKSEICQGIAQGAPLITSYLCDACREHFEGLQQTLSALEIPFEVDPTIVRGLDYYRRTVFEFVSDDIGAQSTVCGGDGMTGWWRSWGETLCPASALDWALSA